MDMMMQEKTTHSFLISLSIHAIMFLLLVITASPVKKMGMDVIFRKVDILQGAEAERIQKWLKEIKAQRIEEKIDTIPQVDYALKIKERFIQKMDLKDTQLSKNNRIKESPINVKLSEQLKEKFIVGDSKSYLNKVSEFKINTVNGMIDAGSSNGFASDYSGGNETALGERIKVAFHVDDSITSMSLQDNPIYIRNKISGGSSDVRNGRKSADSQVVSGDVHRKARIIGELRNRAVISSVMPEVPITEAIYGKKVNVMMRVTVLGDGTVKNNLVVEETSGFDYIDKSVINAVLQWIFAPLPKNRAWQEQMGIINFEFHFI